MIATGLGANANELVRDWPKGQYRGGHPDWLAIGQAVRAVANDRGARYTGVVGKGSRAWMNDPNVYLYPPAQTAFVNTIGARPGELGTTVDPETGREDTWTPQRAGTLALVALSMLGVSAWLLTSSQRVAR